MNIEDLKAKMEVLNYPENHMFDVATMNARGVLTKRMELLKKNVPELFQKHYNFLDIGCNKGFMCFHLMAMYEKITGYEVAKEICEFANQIKKYYGINNIEFINKGFKSIPVNKKYDIVYVGNVQHYLFRDDIIAGKKPFTFLNKLKKITKKILILDGNFEITDFAINALANENNWSDKIRQSYTIDGFKQKLLPQFKLTNFTFNGIGEGFKIDN
jgi:SAM-dependent methyltransferase